MAQQTPHQFFIKNGPSKFDLMVSLLDGDSTSRKTVEIEYGNRPESPIQIKRKINIRIDSLEREDGSGENWIFKGYQVTEIEGLRRVEGYYALRTRTGHIRFFD